MSVTEAQLRQHAHDQARELAGLLAGVMESATLVQRARAQAAIPTVIVGGFLGAGKTSLLRHLLSAPKGIRIAAVVNDFAALNIDQSLIAQVSGDTTTLDNGCICCSQSAGVARALAVIVQRHDPPDAIVVEASGVADSAAVAHAIGSIAGIQLDSVVCVVDAVAPPYSEVLAPLLRRQVAAADLIVLNKTDLVSPAQAAAQVDTVRAWAPQAQLVQTVHGALPPELVLGWLQRASNWAAAAPPVDDSQFVSCSLQANGTVDRAALQTCLAKALPGVLRVKGFVALAPGGSVVLVQALGRRWQIQPSETRPNTLGLAVIGLRCALSEQDICLHFAGLGLRPMASALRSTPRWPAALRAADIPYDQG